MNMQSRQFRQYGFFDLGLGLALFTAFGTTAVVMTPEQPELGKEKLQVCSKQIETKTHAETGCSENSLPPIVNVQSTAITTHSDD